jgi:hypothetical protein
MKFFIFNLRAKNSSLSSQLHTFSEGHTKLKGNYEQVDSELWCGNYVSS